MTDVQPATHVGSFVSFVIKHIHFVIIINIIIAENYG